MHQSNTSKKALLLDDFCDDIEIYDSNIESPNFPNIDMELLSYKNNTIQLKNNEKRNDFDAIGWWIANRKLFPRLFKIYLNISSIQPTSSSSERCFSTTGSIKTARRAKVRRLMI